MSPRCCHETWTGVSCFDGFTERLFRLGLGGGFGNPRLLPPSLLTLGFVSPSCQDVHGRRLRPRQQQRCPAEPPVLLAAGDGGDPQPHCGEWPRRPLISAELTAKDTGDVWLREKPQRERIPAAGGIQLAIDALQGGLKELINNH